MIGKPTFANTHRVARQPTSSYCSAKAPDYRIRSANMISHLFRDPTSGSDVIYFVLSYVQVAGRAPLAIAGSTARLTRGSRNVTLRLSSGSGLRTWTR